MRVWLVGGGTAGHVLPLLSVATALERRLNADGAAQIRIVSDRSSTARHLLKNYKQNYAVNYLFSGKYRRYRNQTWWGRLFDVKTIALNIRDVLLLIFGILQAIYLVLVHKPDVIFINGGSIGVPVSVAARLRRIPYIVHESDTVMGLANRVIARRAAAIATAFDVNLLKLKSSIRTVETGIPLKPQFLQPAKAETSTQLVQQLGLEQGLPVVLAIGGSLGAQRLNEWLISQADDLLEKCQLILITGENNFEYVNQKLAEHQPALYTRLHLLAFTENMAALMQLADLVVTRAGATTLMELAAIGRPALIVPNDMLSGGHQTANAQWFAAAGMAEQLSEASIESDPSILIRVIKTFLEDEPRRRRLAEAIKKVHKPDSADRVAQLIVETKQGKPNGTQ